MSTTPSVRRIAAGLAIALVLAPPRGEAAAQPAQTAVETALLERPARLRVRDVALLDALRELERRSGIPLAYSPSLLPAQTTASCRCEDATLREALDTLLAASQFSVREADGRVLLLPAPRTAAAAPDPEAPGAIGVLTAPLLLAAPAAPQRPVADSATITGTITTDGGAPIIAALVTLPSRQLSTTTDESGTYRLVVPPDRFVAGADSLRVTRIGFRPATARFTVAPGRVVVNVTMATNAVALDQVVVTGTAGNQERRAQAAVVSTIDAAEITSKAPVLDVNELLYARTPGVSMTKASGTSGSNTRIDIRGQASISLSNYPLVFIDGVRVAAGPRSVIAAPGGTTAGAGGQQLNALNDLNPEDIESIEIVKGPAASTLYGSDASAGVIQILTKKGRAGQKRFTQTLTAQYDNIDPNFTPFTTYGTCTAPLVAATSPSALCKGQTVGTVVHANVLERDDIFDNGLASLLQYTATGGGETFGYFGSFAGDYERGTSPGSYLKHRTGRVNVNWIASPKLRVDVSAPLQRIDDRLPQGDQSSFGFLIGAGFASPLTVTTNASGKQVGGWLNNNLTKDAVAAINTRDLTIRSTPSVQANYTPFSWLNNRITIGADLVRTTASQFFPKNDKGWYSATANTGSVAVNELTTTTYTVDYLGNINKRFGSAISSDLSFGSQWINRNETQVVATGQGLLVNSNNLVSAATTTAASQDFGQQISFGFFAQEQLGFKDKLYLQFGGRADRNSAFGASVGTFFLPKAGVSYVISEESFWQNGLGSLIPTFRLRAAYGATGRSPSGTASLQTYSRAPYLTDAGVVQPGVTPGNPGNADLEPERGTEFEGGFDAGFFNDRAGLEVTYFAKTTKDLLLRRPLPPSAGFAQNPFVNIGEVTNKGIEVALRATPVQRRNVIWDANVNANTLANKIVSMGNITPFISNNQCFKPGVDVAGYCVPAVISIDTIAKRAVVTDTAVFVGGQLPRWGGSVNSTLTLFRNFRLYALVEGKFDYKVYNLVRDFRDRSLANTPEVQLPAGQGGYSLSERTRRLGNFFTKTSGAAIGAALVRGPYMEDGDFVRFRELSATVTLPRSLTNRIRVGGASLSVGGSNLGLWTKYSGWDPEVLGTVDNTTPNVADVFTLPQARRAFARVNLQF